MKEKRDDLLQCSSPHMALQTKTSHSGQISKGRGTSTAGIFHIMASFAPGNFLLGQNLRIFFSFEFLWHTQLIEVTCSHNELLWLLMCPKQIFELFSAAGPACPECTELCCAHTFFFFCSLASRRTWQHSRGETQHWDRMNLRLWSTPVSFGLPCSWHASAMHKDSYLGGEP